jgi:eukaryotic translation initiation factor 2C
VKDHYREAYGLNLRYPNIIGVNLAGRKSLRQEVVPIELCRVTEGQFYKRKVPDELMAQGVTAFAKINRLETIRKAVLVFSLIKSLFGD